MTYNWIERLAHFDRQRILPKISDSIYRSLILHRVVRDLNPTNTRRIMDRKPVLTYLGEFNTEVEGCHAKISDLEFIVSPDMPGYKMCGYNIAFPLGQAGSKPVSIVDTRSLDKDIGPRIVFGSEEKWTGVKYDIETDVLFGEGYCFFEDGLYSHVARLVAMAEEVNCGIHVKPLQVCPTGVDGKSSQGRLILGSHHIYPNFKRDVSVEDQKQRLTGLYQKGKQMFGDAFFINFESQGVVRQGPVYEHLRRICKDN